jgi:hypothetical protein
VRRIEFGVKFFKSLLAERERYLIAIGGFFGAYHVTRTLDGKEGGGGRGGSEGSECNYCSEMESHGGETFRDRERYYQRFSP